MPILVQQCFQTADFLGFLDAVKRVSGYTHDAAGLRDVLQLFGQVQQALLCLMML
jgi:hypothetical protein